MTAFHLCFVDSVVIWHITASPLIFLHIIFSFGSCQICPHRINSSLNFFAQLQNFISLHPPTSSSLSICTILSQQTTQQPNTVRTLTTLLSLSTSRWSTQFVANLDILKTFFKISPHYIHLFPPPFQQSPYLRTMYTLDPHYHLIHILRE
jgi:hypothetical protein